MMYGSGETPPNPNSGRPSQGGTMFKLTMLAGAAVAGLIAAGTAAQAETGKVGGILPYSGTFARLGATMDEAIKLWAKENGESVASTKIGPLPPTPRRP